MQPGQTIHSTSTQHSTRTRQTSDDGTDAASFSADWCDSVGDARATVYTATTHHTYFQTSCHKE